MVQRLLAARNEGESRLALFGSWIVIAVQFTLFLVIGAILFVYYLETGDAPPSPADRIYPQFIWNNLPPGIAGLVIAAILAAAMSNLSAALNCLGLHHDHGFLQAADNAARGMAAFRSTLPETRAAGHDWLGESSCSSSGLVARNWGSVLEAGLSIASILYGALLGVFLLGLLTRRTSESGAMAGMVASLLMMFYVKQYTSDRMDMVRPHRERDHCGGRISLLVCSPQADT